MTTGKTGKMNFRNGVLAGAAIVAFALISLSAIRAKKASSYFKAEYLASEEECFMIVDENRHLKDSLTHIYENLDEIYKFTWQNIDFWLDYYQVKFQRVAKAQIILETNSLTSKICLKNNNLFGMKLAKYRPTTAKGIRYKHAYYDNFIESIRDYKLYQDYFLVENCPDEYSYLKMLETNRYATAMHYVEALRKIIERDFPDGN
ncbi:MAG: glucosaminidase domain-containing protein [Bacteroidales bacterium]|nr:glucosaminidase domain-containing protein [Bacteroidales bacterium]